MKFDLHRRASALVATAILGVGCGSAPEARAPKPTTSLAQKQAKDNAGRVRELQARCSEVPPGGAEALARVQAWIPVVNSRPGDKPLRDVATDYVGKGIVEVCWGAAQKGTGRWKVWYDYIDIQGAFQTAEWELDPASGDVKPFNANAQTFWTGTL